MQTQSQNIMKRGRGRPQQNGVQPGWVLFRIVEVLRLFDRYRDEKSKFETAVYETVKEFKRLYPDIPINATEVRRIHRAAFDSASGMAWIGKQTMGNNGQLIIGLQWRERLSRKRRNSLSQPAIN
jgi:hypothetical protein